MNMILYQDVEFSHQVIAILEDESLTEDERMMLMTELVQRETKSQNKIESMVKFIRTMEVFATACKAEEERLSANRKMAEKTVDKLKTSISDYLQLKNKTKLFVGTFRLSLRHSEAVEILDEAEVPEEYKTYKTEVSISKSAIKEAIRGGQSVSGAVLQDHQNLQIR